MAKKVILTADSTADLTPELRKRYHVEGNYPLHITYGDESRNDNVDIFADEVFARFKAEGVLPKTAAISVGEYVDYFSQYTEQGFEVVHINLGSHLSCTHSNAKLAAEQLEGVYCIDSQNLSTGTGLLVIEAAERIAKGMSAAEVAAEVNELVSKSHASFVLDTLKFLAAGGRCSTVAALGANLLQIKPSIEVDNKDGGAMNVGKKYRGKLDKCVLEYVRDQLARYDDIRPDRIFITHSGISKEIVDMIRAELESRNFFKEIIETSASCTISSHCGPNCVGILFMTEK